MVYKKNQFATALKNMHYALDKMTHGINVGEN